LRPSEASWPGRSPSWARWSAPSGHWGIGDVDALAADVTVLEPGAVILPIAIYK
jgi:hypothetical protein